MFEGLVMPDRSSDTALCRYKYNILLGNFRWVIEKNKERKKNTYSQTSRLEKPEDIQLKTISMKKNPVFDCAVALCAKCKTHDWAIHAAGIALEMKPLWFYYREHHPAKCHLEAE
jgi:hypothetical protein